MFRTWRRPFPYALWKPSASLGKAMEIVPEKRVAEKPVFDHREPNPGVADISPEHGTPPGLAWDNTTRQQRYTMRYLRDMHRAAKTLTKGRDFATFGALAAYQANAVAHLYGEWKKRGGNPLDYDAAMPNMSVFELPYTPSVAPDGTKKMIPQLTLTRNGKPLDMMRSFNRLVKLDKEAGFFDGPQTDDDAGNPTYHVSPQHGWLYKHVAERYGHAMKEAGRHWIDTIMDPALTWKHLCEQDRAAANSRKHGWEVREIGDDELANGLRPRSMPEHVQMLFDLASHHHRLSSMPE